MSGVRHQGGFERTVMSIVTQSPKKNVKNIFSEIDMIVRQAKRDARNAEEKLYCDQFAAKQKLCLLIDGKSKPTLIDASYRRAVRLGYPDFSGDLSTHLEYAAYCGTVGRIALARRILEKQRSRLLADGKSKRSAFKRHFLNQIDTLLAKLSEHGDTA